MRRFPAVPEPYNQWYSLELLLDYYSVALLATAIEMSGVFVIDEFGRKVIASGSSSEDRRSAQYALLLLADRYAELENPGPDYSWRAERWESEPHPLCFFGWPVEEFPDLQKLITQDGMPKPASKVLSWTERTPDEFVKEKNQAGSFAKAAKIHGVTRQRYTEVFNKVVSSKP